MKKLFTILLLSISFWGFGQQKETLLDWYALDTSGITMRFDSFPGGFFQFQFDTAADFIIHSKYDTTVLYEGDTHCQHRFVEERKPLSFYGCLVNHGPEGCPNRWLNQNSICIYCLRHINIKETRTVEPVKDEYQEALERLNKKLNK